MCWELYTTSIFLYPFTKLHRGCEWISNVDIDAVAAGVKFLMWLWEIMTIQLFGQLENNPPHNIDQ